MIACHSNPFVPSAIAAKQLLVGLCAFSIKSMGNAGSVIRTRRVVVGEVCLQMEGLGSQLPNRERPSKRKGRRKCLLRILGPPLGLNRRPNV
jgi:hypothetical protein